VTGILSGVKHSLREISGASAALVVLMGLALAPATGARAERAMHGHVVIGRVSGGGDGELDLAIVQRLARTRRAAFTSCYDRELRSQPRLHGDLVMSVTITESGTTADVRVIEDHLGSAAIAACVTRIFTTLRFSPGPAGGSVTASVPLSFRVGE
jgi:hypothetical protein